MTAPAPIEKAVYRLLYHRTFRAAFVRGEREALGLAPEVEAALAAIDLEQLAGMARAIARSVQFGGGAEGDGLLAVFPGVFAELAAEGRSAAAAIDRFLESEAFADYRSLPFAGAGVCLPEAFHRWLAGEPGWDEPRRGFLLDHELLVAVMTLLSIHRDPSFVVRTPLVRHNPAAWYAVRTVEPAIAAAVGGLAGGGVLVLYAASGTRRIVGPVPPLVGALIELGDRGAARAAAGELAARFAVAGERVAAVAARLHDLGLIA
jgi:hypothetical protein